MILDNSTTVNNSRLVSTVGITSNGATIEMLGAGASQTVGKLTLSTGSTNIEVANGSTMTFGNLSHSTGGFVNFYSNTGAQKNTVLPAFSPGAYNVGTLSNTNGIIAGWATYGNVGFSGGQFNTTGDSTGTNPLDFATFTSGTTVGAYSAYTVVNTGTNIATGATTNVKVTGTSSLAAAGTTTINSLYLTSASLVTIASGKTLVIGSGGIIANQTTLTFQGSGPQIAMSNVADLGSGTNNTGANTTGGTPVGTITAGTLNSATPADLVITNASNLRIDAASIVNYGTEVVNLTKNGSGWLDLSDGNGTTQTNSYTGITTINGGLVTIRNDRNLGAVPGSNTANSITLNGGELRMTATTLLACGLAQQYGRASGRHDQF